MNNFNNWISSYLPSYIEANQQLWLSENKAIEYRDMMIRLEIMKDNWSPVVWEYIRQVFKVDAPNVQKHIKIDKNPFKNVINQISTIYLRGASRAFKNGDADDKNAAECYSRIQALDDFMQQVNKRVNSMNTAIVLVLYDDVKDCIALRLFDFTSCEVEFKVGRPLEIEEIEFQGEVVDEKGKRIFASIYWTDNEYWIEEENEKKKAPAGYPDMKNPYKIITAVPIFREYNPDSFWDTTTGTDLVCATLSGAVMLSGYEFSQLFNQMRQIFVSGGKVGSQIVLGANRILNVTHDENPTNQNPEVGVLDMNVNYKAQIESIKADRESVLSTYGLTDIAVGVSNSGISLSIMKSQKLEVVQKQIPTYREAERRIFDMIRIVWNVHNPNKPINENTKISVSFKYGFSLLTADELKEDIVKCKSGVMPALDFLSKYTGFEGTEEQARQYLQDNSQFFNSILVGV